VETGSCPEIEFNPAAEDVFRHSRQDALGMDISRMVLLPGLLSAPSWKDFWNTYGDGIRDRRIEAQARRTDGCEFPVEVTVTSVPIDNRILYALFLRDISITRQSQEKLRNLECQLVQAQKMEAIGISTQIHKYYDTTVSPQRTQSAQRKKRG
jgi:PAS domain S-box-containing protein